MDWPPGTFFLYGSHLLLLQMEKSVSSYQISSTIRGVARDQGMSSLLAELLDLLFKMFWVSANIWSALIDPMEINFGFFCACVRSTKEEWRTPCNEANNDLMILITWSLLQIAKLIKDWITETSSSCRNNGNSQTVHNQGGKLPKISSFRIAESSVYCTSIAPSSRLTKILSPAARAWLIQSQKELDFLEVTLMVH